MYLYDIFLKMNTGQEISYTEIRSFMELTGTKLKPWEVETLIKVKEAIREGFTSG